MWFANNNLQVYVYLTCATTHAGKTGKAWDTQLCLTGLHTLYVDVLK